MADTRYQILHVRDPDDGCTIRLWVDGTEVEATVEDVDPGRGHDRADWTARVQGYAGDRSPFGEAAHEALAETSDSPHIHDCEARS